MTKRRVAEAATPNAKAPGRSASMERRRPQIKGDDTFRDALRAGGLLGFEPKEMFR